MNAEIYRFKVGSFECMAVSDGSHAYPDPAPFLFLNAPKGYLQQVLREHDLQPEEWVQWVSPYTCLVINTGRHQVLVDTGAGSLTPSTGNLLQNLQAEGIDPWDIDRVILTHGYPDHIGGNTNGEGKPAYPTARYVMWKDEWEFWTSTSSLVELKVDKHVKQLLLAVTRNNLSPIQGQLDLVDREAEIVPGVHAVEASGHTPGHMALVISSGSERLLYISDTVLHPVHLEHPDWYAIVDFAPDQAVATRRELFNRTMTKKGLVLAFHFPFPGLGHVIQKGEGWQWQLIETTD